MVGPFAGPAGLDEVAAEALVRLVDVARQPDLEEVQKFEGDGRLARVELVLEGLHLGDQVLVVLLVGGELGVVRHPHQALLDREVGAGVVGQLVQDLARGGRAMVFLDRDVKLVEQLDELLVLFVDLLQADAELVGPMEQFGTHGTIRW